MNQSGMNQGDGMMASTPQSKRDSTGTRQQQPKQQPQDDGSSYEDDFEKELESELSGSYEDGRNNGGAARSREGAGAAGKATASSHGNNGYGGSSTVVLLDHTAYPDCDGDLERELTLGLRRGAKGGGGSGGGGRLASDYGLGGGGATNGHYYQFERDDRATSRGADDGVGAAAAHKARQVLEFFRRSRSGSTGGDQQDNFFDAAEEVGYDSTPDSGVHESLLNMDPEQRARLEEEWKNDLAKTEDEIQTLRSVLSAKVRHSQDLKRKLGITVWREFREDWEQGFKNVKESDALKSINDKLSEVQVAITNAPLYQKTETVLKTASEKTTTVIGTLSASVTKKIGEVKNSPTFKSFEEKVGSAYTNVRTKVSGSRSNSMQSFEEALANAEGRTSTGATPSTTPMIPEDKPLL